MGYRTYKGYKFSENGWPIVDNQDIETVFLPGLNNVRIEVRKGSVSKVLRAWMYWYHRNVEPIDIYQPRDEWGYSWDNLVPNSNHLSGTAVDINATQYPWGTYKMPQRLIDKVNEGLRLFEGNIFWGRNWSKPDEMHYQIGHADEARLDRFAAKLDAGYLGIFAPPDPKAYPLPLGQYYGPLDGPAESVSGQWSGDLPAYREALKRWQKAAGIPETGIYDTKTREVCLFVQKRNGWPQHGTLNTGEWEAIMKFGIDVDLPAFDNVPKNEEQTGVYYADVSQYQVHVDDSYPHQILCLRSNSGDKLDEKFTENYRRALDLVRRGKLKAIIVYYFFRPGQANCDLWKASVTVDGKIPESVVCMVDVEGAPDKHGNRTITGNHSAEINDEVQRVRGWLGDAKRVIGYHNRKADPDLWITKPAGGIRMVVPWYNNNPGQSPEYEGLIAHQYTDKGPCKPFGTCDMNFANLRMSQFLEQIGLTHMVQKLDAAEEAKWGQILKELKG